jgi:hypothetical protein
VLTLLSEVEDKAFKLEKEATIFEELVDQVHGFMFLDVFHDKSLVCQRAIRCYQTEGYIFMSFFNLMGNVFPLSFISFLNFLSRIFPDFLMAMT